MPGYRITLHARRRARAHDLTIEQLREAIDLDDAGETMPKASDDRTGKRSYCRLATRESHIILVVNPASLT